MSKQMEERVALLGISKAGKTTLVEQLAHADPIRINNPPTTPHDGVLHTHNPTDNMMMVSSSESQQPVRRCVRAKLKRKRRLCTR
jgi:signal recognition particle receptor subunit beta